MPTGFSMKSGRGSEIEIFWAGGIEYRRAVFGRVCYTEVSARSILLRQYVEQLTYLYRFSFSLLHS